MSGFPGAHAGRVAVVTGAASGLGRTYAERLARDGAQVVVADVSSGAETVEAIRSAGGMAVATQCDVASPDAVSALREVAYEHFDRCDILVNNAGIFPSVPWDELDFATWRSVLSVNLDSMFLTCKAFSPGMREHGFGRIVNISSSTFDVPVAGFVHYVTSKAGVIGLTRALATDLGVQGITVNCVIMPATLHVEEGGDGIPTLVFMHYWGGSSRTWHPAIDRLAESARCVAIDHRGWGRSSAPAVGYATGDLAADATAAITALGLDDYVLVGHSIGGKVAQLLASQRLDGLRGAVLVAPAPAKPVLIPEAVRAQMAAAYNSRDAVVATLDTVLRYASLSDELREQVIEDSLAGASQAKHDWPAHTVVEDVSADLERINVPVLVVAGEHDRVEPVEVMRSHVIAEIAGAELTIPLERPKEISDCIAAFRDTITRG